MPSESLLSCISPFCGIYGINDRKFRSEVIQGHEFCSFWSRSVMLGSAESEIVTPISRDIIFAEIQPM